MSYEAFDHNDLEFDTMQVHSGYDPSQHLRSKAVPIYQTAAFELGDFERCGRLFSYQEDGYSYVRFSNPTNDVLEKRISALERGMAAVAFSSGMGAISNTFLSLVRSVDHIAAVTTVY